MYLVLATHLYLLQADEVLGYSASLGSDKNRVISDYWADFKNSSLPPGVHSIPSGQGDITLSSIDNLGLDSVLSPNRWHPRSIAT